MDMPPPKKLGPQQVAGASKMQNNLSIWVSVPDPAGGAYSTPPRRLNWQGGNDCHLPNSPIPVLGTLGL